MEIAHAVGVDGARSARGIVVVIDVLRSFTVSAYALAGGARECVLVTTVDEARRLADEMPDAIVCAEQDALPIPGIAISNSPTQIKQADLSGKTLIQRSTAGTPVVWADPAPGPASFFRCMTTKTTWRNQWKSEPAAICSRRARRTS